MSEIYWVISKKEDKVRKFDTACKTSIFFLGRAISDYIVVKTAGHRSKVVDLPVQTVTEIENILSCA